MLLATQQATSADTSSKKWASHSKKQQTAAESSSSSSETEDSSEDLSDSSDTSTSDDPPPTETKPLMSEQAETMLAGATASVTYPAEEALLRHPAGMLTPCPKVIGCWEAPLQS